MVQFTSALGKMSSSVTSEEERGRPLRKLRVMKSAAIIDKGLGPASFGIRTHDVIAARLHCRVVCFEETS